MGQLLQADEGLVVRLEDEVGPVCVKRTDGEALQVREAHKAPEKAQEKSYILFINYCACTRSNITI